MHSHIRELCGVLHEAGIGITLLSSGLLLARDAAWLPELVDDVVVSLDGPRAVHDAIRNVPRAFDRLAEGVRALRARAPELAITARCTVQRANAAHLLETARAAREIGCTRVSFLAVDVAAGAFHRAGEAPGLAPDPDVVVEQVEALVREVPEAFLAESPEKLRRLAAHFRALAGEGDFPARVCNAPWVSSVVEADGTVRPCFFHPPIGNVNESESLETVLNSERAVAFRRGLDIATDPVCRRCVCSLALRSHP
jgi:MoaA/NifB/PqqE/SkfB family radical SAM enzyme